MDQPNDLRFYILMRNDLASMNTGKAIAQGGHAVSMFVEHVVEHANRMTQPNWNPGDRLTAMVNSYNEWSGDRGFGTKITLGLSGREIEETLGFFSLIESQVPLLVYGKVIDPSYPLRDGDVTHLIPLMTCGWVFGSQSVLKPFLSRFTLHP